jgi:hypothetical protein
MELNDVQRMADSVLRDYGVPMTVSTISPVAAGWTIAFTSRYPGSPSVEVRLGCDKSSMHHVRESLKRGLSVCD